MTKTQTDHPIVPEAEWLAARKELLAKEKDFSRLRDALSAERRKLPWVKVEKKYAFDTPGGKRTLADELDEIALRSASRPVLDNRTPDEILGYDENGLPT